MNIKKLAPRLRNKIPIEIQKYLIILGEKYSENNAPERINYNGSDMKLAFRPLLTLQLSYFDSTHSIDENIVWHEDNGGYWDWEDNHNGYV